MHELIAGVSESKLHNVSKLLVNEFYISHDVASGIEITPCNKIDKSLSLVIYRFSGTFLTSIATLRI